MFQAKRLHGCAQATDRSAGTRDSCPGKAQPSVCWLCTQVHMCQRSHCVLLHVSKRFRVLLLRQCHCLVVGTSPFGLSTATSSKLQGAAVSRSTWDHMAGNVSGSQEFSFTWIAVILGVTLTLSLPSCHASNGNASCWRCKPTTLEPSNTHASCCTTGSMHMMMVLANA